METALIILIVLLGIIVIAQAVRVFELTSSIKGDASKETEITDKDNQTQGFLLLIWLIIMLGSFIWMMFSYGKVILPEASSEHGLKIDNLMTISMGLIIVAFLVTQPLLFGFAWRFRGNKKRKAVYMEHNNRLEFIWTIIPAVILAGLIIYGLATWSDIMNPAMVSNDNGKDPLVVEIYAKQFGWTARYAGEDNQLGYANVRNIGGTNVLGLDIDDEHSFDDVITNELHLPVDREVILHFRSQDVIHSAFMPHFRVQMNVVPGTKTNFRFTPTMTTEEMRASDKIREQTARINDIREAKGEDPYEFDYLLLCNKICGSAHYNMQMKVKVVSAEEYEKWYSEQKSFAESL